MDLELLIWWSQSRPNLVEGSIVECREVNLNHSSWDAAKKEYVPIQGAIYSPNCVMIYITGCPITIIDEAKHLLEERPDEALYSEARWWSAKRNALHPVQEGTPLMTRGYLTLTWERLKDIVENIDGLNIDDTMLGDAYWEAKVGV
jgi:hypothetical protein